MKGGGNIVSTLRKSYSLSDLSESDMQNSQDEVTVEYHQRNSIMCNLSKFILIQVDYMMYCDPNMHVLQQRYIMRQAMNNNNIGPLRSIPTVRNGDMIYPDMNTMVRQLDNYE